MVSIQEREAALFAECVRSNPIDECITVLLICLFVCLFVYLFMVLNSVPLNVCLFIIYL